MVTWRKPLVASIKAREMSVKIVDIEFVLLSSPYRVPERIRSYGVVAVRTEDGRVGVGEPYAGVNMPTVCREAVEILKPMFIGKDASDFRQLIQRCQDTVEYFDHRGMIRCLIGAMDWAFHDLAAQCAGLPLHRFLNPGSRASVELYASTGLITWTIPELMDELTRRISEGYQTIKIRVGCGREDVEHAISRSLAAAKAIDGRARLGVDAGQQIFVENRWPIEDSMRLAEVLGDLGVNFFEDPLLISDIEGYRALRHLKKAPIAGGEMLNDPEDFDRYFDAGALDVAQPDACVLPGPAAAMAVAESAHQRGIRVILHGWAGPVAQMQNIHIALASPACEMVEFCPLLHPLLADGLSPIWRFRNGMFTAPAVPGMGVVPIDELAKRFPFQGVSSLIA